jgi:hypothetical protein
VRLPKDQAFAFIDALEKLKALCDQFERLDPVHAELATAYACTGRARRLLLARDEPEQLDIEGTKS